MHKNMKKLQKYIFKGNRQIPVEQARKAMSEREKQKDRERKKQEIVLGRLFFQLGKI
jgi:hypothetical protein